MKTMKPLKNSVLIFLISVFAIYGCQKSPVPLTETEKEAIRTEVRGTFSQLNAAMNSHNVDEMRKYFSDTEDFIYAGSGNIYTKLDDLFKVIASVHSNPDLLPFTVDFNEIKVNVLNKELVMLTGKGIINNAIGTDKARSLQITITFLMKKTEGKWLTIVGHESYKGLVL